MCNLIETAHMVLNMVEILQVIFSSGGSRISQVVPAPKGDANLLFDQFSRKVHEYDESLARGCLLPPP